MTEQNNVLIKRISNTENCVFARHYNIQEIHILHAIRSDDDNDDK